MPSVVAACALIVGAAVTIFSAFYARTETGATGVGHPTISLSPASTDEPMDGGDELHIRVTTPEGRGVEGVEVQPVPLFHGESEGESPDPGDTNARGEATLEAQPTPDRPYLVDVLFDGETFSSPVLRSGNEPSDPVQIVVAPTTKDDDGITIEAESVAVVGGRDGVQVVHAVSVRNRGDEAYTGGLRLQFIPGATAIDPRSPLDRRRLELTDDAMVSTAPLVPGRSEITYTYTAQMPRRGIDATFEAAYPTRRFDLLTADGLAADELDGLAPADGITLSGRDYRRFSVRDLDPSEQVSARIAPTEASPVLLIGAIVAVGALAIFIVVFPVLRRRRKT